MHDLIQRISRTMTHSEHVSAPDLSLFNGADMSVAEFREMLRRQARILLTYQELAALLPEIGSKTTPNMINTSEFVIKFKAMGWKERQKKRSKQLKKIENIEEELKRLFRMIDTDGSMLLSRSEFKEFLGELHISFSNKRWRQIFRYVCVLVCLCISIYIFICLLFCILCFY